MKLKKLQLTPKDYVTIGFTFIGMLAMLIATVSFLTAKPLPLNEGGAMSSSASSDKTELVESSSSTSKSSSSDKTASSTTTASSSEVYMDVAKFRYKYTAVGGETLADVATLTEVDVATIAAANKLAESAILTENQEIYIP